MTKPERSAANVLAWAKEVGCPPLQILDAREDRCLIAYSPALRRWLDLACDPWDLAIRAHRPVEFSIACWGWRERRALWAAQIIEHSTPEARFFEIDFDDANPARGLAPLIGHAFQWLRHKLLHHKTDPFTVARKRGWEDSNA